MCLQHVNVLCVCVVFIIFKCCVLSSGDVVHNPILLVHVHTHMMLINVPDGGMIICNVESS